jgi:hypothetical protein
VERERRQRAAVDRVIHSFGEEESGTEASPALAKEEAVMGRGFLGPLRDRATELALAITSMVLASSVYHVFGRRCTPEDQPRRRASLPNEETRAAD